MKQFYTSLSPSPPLLRFIVPSHPWTTGRESSLLLLLTCFSYYSCRCRQNASDCGCRRVDILFVCAWVSEWESVCEWVCIRLLVQGRGEMRRLKQSTVLSYARIFLVLVYFLSVHPLFASYIVPGLTYSGVQVTEEISLLAAWINRTLTLVLGLSWHSSSTQQMAQVLKANHHMPSLQPQLAIHLAFLTPSHPLATFFYGFCQKNCLQENKIKGSV